MGGQVICVYIRFSDILTVFKTWIFEEPSKQCHVERIVPEAIRNPIAIEYTLLISGPLTQFLCYVRLFCHHIIFCNHII